jgi:hypothetical protein
MTENSATSEITNAMRNYLADIYRLGQGGSWVSTTTLAQGFSARRSAYGQAPG